MIFSVIVPFLNEEKYIEKRVKALLDQDFPKREYEIIFVDNGSTDGSVEMVKKYKRVKLLFEGAKSQYKARNKGLEEARGEIIAFTDADCVADKNWLREIFQAIKRPDVGIVFGVRAFPAEKNSLLKIYEEYENEKARYMLSQSSRDKIYGYTNNMSIQKDYFDKYGNFKVEKESGLSCDTELIQRFLTKDARCAVFSEKIKVLHLEIKSLKDWYRKLMVYGELNKLLEKYTTHRSLSLGDNLSVMYSLLMKDLFNLPRAFKLALSLMTGFIFYDIGRLKFVFSSASSHPENYKNLAASYKKE